MQTLIPILFSIVASVPGLPKQSCSEPEQSLIQNKLKESSNYKPYIPFELDKTKYYAVCNVYHPDILDGMAYVLFKTTDSKKYYIGVYNGLDGNHMLHGPFNK